jgi:hypothetical protein
MRARHRLSKLLLRYGLVWQQSAWTDAHQRWLHKVGLELDRPGVRVAFDEALAAVLGVQARRDRLDGAIGELAAQPAWALVGRLGCLRGVGTLTGLGLAVEVGDWRRFTGATIGAFLGLAVRAGGEPHADAGAKQFDHARIDRDDAAVVALSSGMPTDGDDWRFELAGGEGRASSRSGAEVAACQPRAGVARLQAACRRAAQQGSSKPALY